MINTLSEFEFIFAESPLTSNTWWNDPVDKNTPTTDVNHASESINYLNNFINQEGPFYAILGYSQGAAMAIVYISQNVTNNFSKIILCNGYLPTTHNGLMSIINQNSPYSTSTYIFIGNNDSFRDMSLDIKNIFINYIESISLSAGHHLPYNSDNVFMNLVNFIRNE